MIRTALTKNLLQQNGTSHFVKKWFTCRFSYKNYKLLGVIIKKSTEFNKFIGTILNWQFIGVK